MTRWSVSQSVSRNWALSRGTATAFASESTASRSKKKAESPPTTQESGKTDQEQMQEWEHQKGKKSNKPKSWIDNVLKGIIVPTDRDWNLNGVDVTVHSCGYHHMENAACTSSTKTITTLSDYVYDKLNDDWGKLLVMFHITELS